MKRTIAGVVASVAFAGFVVWGTTEKKNITSLPVVHADAAKGCSLEKVAGNWGFTLTGSATLPTGSVLVAAVGTVAVDDQGNLNGT